METTGIVLLPVFTFFLFRKDTTLLTKNVHMYPGMYLVAMLLCTQDMFQSEAVDIQYRSTKEHGSGLGNGGTNL